MGFIANKLSRGEGPEVWKMKQRVSLTDWDPDLAPITRRLKCQNWRLPLNLPSPACRTGCFLKHEKINSGELLSFKQHSSKEGQAKLNPKTAKRSQHSMKDREKKQSSKLNLFSLKKMRQMRHQISERQILPQMY